MTKLRFLFRSILTLGNKDQSFLDSRFITFMIFIERFIPSGRLSNLFLLFLLSLSPHYFYNRQSYSSLNCFLIGEFSRIQRSRQLLVRNINNLIPLEGLKTLDWGCGLGWLCSSMAEHQVKSVTGVDLSKNVVTIASKLNPDPNILYFDIDSFNKSVDNQAGQFDLITCIAVIQHMTDERLDAFLIKASAILKPHGHLILHYLDETSKSENQKDWEANKSIYGRLKYKYGLNCFSRSSEDLKTKLVKHNMKIVEKFNQNLLTIDVVDDITSEAWVILQKV
jgi:SAM-dependent methyltransferase